MAHRRLARVSSKGQIVLPKIYRDFLGISEGDYVYVKDVGPGLLLLGKIGENNLDETVGTILNEAVDNITTKRKNNPQKISAGEN